MVPHFKTLASLDADTLRVAIFYMMMLSLSLVLTGALTRWLSARQFGKTIREDGPQHQAKAGTPTMGGLAMLFVIAVAWLYMIIGTLLPLTWDDHSYVPETAALLIIMGTTLGFAALGLYDDLRGLARRAGGEVGIGLRARETFLIQVALAGGAGWGILRYVPLTLGPEARLHPALTLSLIVIAILGTVNGVNLADGLDGLAAGLLALAFGGLAIFNYGYGLIGIAGTAAAACLGFLYFNRHPARVFMGNVASMGLGALLAVLAILSGHLILLPLLAAVFLAEVVSDIIQVGWFKWTRRRTGTGRRVFRMAPLHHHFEQSGMHETAVVRRFWAAGLLAAIVAVAVARWIQPGVLP